MTSPLDPDHWRKRAKEARHLAEDMADTASKQMILKIAQGYDNLAVRAAQRRAKQPLEGAKVSRKENGP
jgi:hypothetical protein